VIATILMVAITVVLAGVLYVWANNLASEGTDTSVGTLNTFTTEDADDETGPGAEDTLVKMQLTGKDDLAWSFIKITVSVGDNVYTCSVVAGDDCQISQVAGDDDNAWESGEYLFLSEGTDDICSEAECLLQISVTHNGRTVAGDGVSGQGGNVGSGSVGGTLSGGGNSGGLTNVNFVITGFDEINSGANAVIGEYGGRVLVGNTLYFDAHEGNAGRELWSHNTVTGQNSLAADIRSGGNSGSNPGYYGGIMAVGTTLYFDANDNINGNELWAYETTNSSAWQVADINSGSGSSNPGQYMTILVGDTIYFSANDGSSGIELWVHDTSNSSTWQVADINSGSGDAKPGNFAGFTVMGTRVFFDADDGSNGRELWALDSTNGSTWRVTDINTDGGSHPGRYTAPTVVGNRLYFEAYTPDTSYELWMMEIVTS
ncbi:MAG: type IV pilin, partial [Gammaproteobacteria bacterium]|nr:type IV pilin [Gammaproteobacteria bacterium]